MRTRGTLLRTIFLGMMLFGLMLMMTGLPVLAQQTADQANKSSQPTTSRPKAGKESSCDGALDIVPRKQVSFVRKRRPDQTPSTPGTPTDAKSDKKSSGETAIKF